MKSVGTEGATTDAYDNSDDEPGGVAGIAGKHLTLVDVNLALSRPVRSKQPERGPHAAAPGDVRHVDGDEGADVEVSVALDPHAVTVGARGKSRVAVDRELGDAVIDRDEAEALGFGAVDVAA